MTVHQSSHHHHHFTEAKAPAKSWPLALSATLHCLLGCGIGEVVGMIVATLLHLGNLPSMTLSVLAGFVFGFALGIRPWLKAGYGYRQALRMVLLSEGLSIVVMEAAEVLVEIYTPGVMAAHVTDAIFWIGMILALIAGFAAAFPVNLWLVKRGVQHRH